MPGWLTAALLSTLLVVGAHAAEGGLAGHWRCDEGQGAVLHDSSGNANEGTIKGATWVRSGTGHALQFDGQDDYVDCGNGASLDLTGPLTLQLWAMPTAANRGEPGIAGKFFESYAITYYGNAFFYISSGGNNVSGPTKINAWSHLAATFDGTTMRFYVNGIETGAKPSKFPSVKHGGKFYLGCVVGDPGAADPNLRSTAFFPGLLDDVRVHGRALSQREILESYNQEAAGKGLAVFDTSCFGKLVLEPFFYPEADRVVVAVNARWVLPLPENAEAMVELAPAGETPAPRALQTQAVNVNDPRHEEEVSFSLEGLPAGKYELRGFVRQIEGVVQAEKFARSSPGVSVPTEGWLGGKLDLMRGWTEYEVETGAGEYRLSVLAARLYDSAGIRCTMDGKDPVEVSLNGTEGGSEAVWARTKWQTFGAYTLAAGRHTLRVEAIPATGKDGKAHDVHTYIDAFALEPAAVEAARVKDAQRVVFDYPLPSPPPLPAPTKQVVGALPAPVTPPAYQATLTPGGGLTVTFKGRTFRVESSYSYPHGGFNRLTAGTPDGSGEEGWKISGSGRTLTARGKSYEVQRAIQLQPTRILVRDTIRNTSGDVLGVMLSNHVNLQGVAVAKVTQMTNATIFAAQGDAGLGLIALDDLYQLQQTTAHADDLAAIRDDSFGLDTGAAYTLEWAIYPTATADYYDFISQVRQDEGLNGHVEGTWTGMSLGRVPAREFIDLRRVRYLSLGTPWYPVDDPQVSIEGIEFERYPKERARVREFFAQVKQAHPDVRVMIHVAHGLYACNDPEQRFPDSRAMDSNGRQFDYGGGNEDYYARYWSRERFRDGWRWWIFYPTPENSFGKAMMAAMAQMMDEMGSTALWADGYISGYVRGLYSYDRWDGHSVTIDPQTKLVTVKKNLVPYTALPVLRDVIRLIAQRGGVLITNGMAGPRSLWKEQYLTSNETGGGDARPIGGLHLGRTVTPLGNPSVIETERDVYRDILAKLDFGALYWWYGERSLLTHKTLVEHMYPITFESIHAGTVRGRERIVTKNSGVYGWPGDTALHAVYLYDARGALTRHGFVTTADKSTARTRLDLGPDQSAAVVRIPVKLTAAGPVNVRVLQYDAGGVRLALHGQGQVRVQISNGEYVVGPTQKHRATVDGKPATVSTQGGAVTCTVTLKGPAELVVTPAG
jgi:hypothetical protein